MAEMQTDAAALSAASVEIDGIESFFFFVDSDSESQAGMQDTEQGITGMFASAGDTGGETAKKLASIWGGAGSDSYQQTQSRWDSTAAELNAALKELSDKVGQAGASMQDTEKAVGGMFASAGDAGENINRSGTQYQGAADDSSSSLQGSMGFTPPMTASISR